MLNREAVERTIICYWGDEEQCFIAESPLCQRTTGFGDNPEEARNQFLRGFDEIYQCYLNGELAGYEMPDGPYREKLAVRIQMSTKEYIEEMSKLFGCTEGEVVDYVVEFCQKSELPMGPRSSMVTLPSETEIS